METTRAAEAEQDAALVQRCLDGDAEAFHRLTARYYRPVSAFVLKRVQRPDVVEDLAQEAFLEAFRSLKAGRRPDHFSSWLFGIAHNCCGKWLRRKRPLAFGEDQAEQLAAPPVASLLEEAEEQQRRLAVLEEGLAGLPDEVRRLLDLKHKEGLTCEEIGDRLGRPVGTIKSLLSRTYKLLRARLAPGEVSS
jgi:RNA polymerase sigma-70 factor (ECF subfamily)